MTIKEMVRDFPEMTITVKAGDLPDLAEKLASSDIEKKSAALDKMRNDYVDELNAFGEIVRLVRDGFASRPAPATTSTGRGSRKASCGHARP